jgi:hypothetical protein
MCDEGGLEVDRRLCVSRDDSGLSWSSSISGIEWRPCSASNEVSRPLLFGISGGTDPRGTECRGTECRECGGIELLAIDGATYADC